MSADNCICIIKTKRTALEDPKGVWTNRKENYVYRVAYTTAIDNLDYYKNNQPMNLGAYLKDVWGQSEVYAEEFYALQAAEKMQSLYSYVEYGIVFVDLGDYVFYGDL